MSTVCRSRLNTATGRIEWILEDETYDFYQEIARSGYADMLHDTERNVMFRRGIENVIAEIRGRNGGESVHVLDIGTGTGLLSMMAAAAGAERVTACEAFRPIADTAKKIIAANGFGEKIRIVEKRSTDMTTDDLVDGRANVLVAEVFDTELIGEGALRTFKEAHERLLTPNARVIPKSGTVYAQVINSDFVNRWSSPRPISVQTSSRTTGGDRIVIEPPESVRKCPGSVHVHDLQLDQLPPSAYVPLTDPIPIFTFDFEHPNDLKYDEFNQVAVEIKADSTAHAVFWWWELDMDGTGRVILSTKPDWNRKSEKQWRDHWMQAIYHMSRPVDVRKGAPYWLIGCHDEHSFWFDVRPDPHALHELPRAPACECAHHMICSHGVRGYFNDESRYQRFAFCLEKVVPGKTCLCISDCSRLPFLALKLGAKKVFVLQNDGAYYHQIMREYAVANGGIMGENLVLISELTELTEKVECVFGEPFFFQALLPWNNLHFWYKVDEARSKGCLTDDCCVIPKKAHLKGIALQFRDLWKIRAPVQSVEGFDLRLFDVIVQKAIELCDAHVEPHTLWEYPSTALSKAVRIASYDLTSGLPKGKVSSAVSELTLEHPGTLTGMAFWMDWELGDDRDGKPVMISTGLSSTDTTCEPGEEPRWNWFTRQGVYFFPYPYSELRSPRNNGEKVDLVSGVQVRSIFDSRLGDISFDIRLS